jgi:dTDP-D-glucose 4,6-dehydratase
MDVLDIIRAYELALTKCKSGEVYNITIGKPRWIKKEI